VITFEAITVIISLLWILDGFDIFAINKINDHVFDGDLQACHDARDVPL
jgi:hypothetical protein